MERSAPPPEGRSEREEGPRRPGFDPKRRAKVNEESMEEF
jgi:hypothetical protein